MSHYSSDEEIGDSLQIKPPQLRPKSRDRPRRRDREHREYNLEPSYRGGRSVNSYRKDYDGGYEGPRRREYEHNSLRRVDEAFVDRPPRQRREYEPERSHRKRGPDDRHLLDQAEKRYQTNRQEPSLLPPRYKSESPPARDDTRQLLKHKKKRKHAEEEEERVFREIERRRERERRKEEARDGGNEESGSSGSHKRSKASRREIPEKPYSRDSDIPRSDNEEMLDLTVSDEDVQNLLPSIDVQSDPESSSEEEVVNSRHSDSPGSGESVKKKKGIPQQPDKRTNTAASDISSDEENRNQSDTSKDESASEDSESDSSASENSKKTKHRKDATNGKLIDKNERKANSKSGSSSDESVQRIDSDEEGDPIPLEKDTLTGTAEEKKVEKEEPMTEVEKACHELDLLPPYYPSIQGCRRVEEFQLLNRIEEGTYGVVYRAKDKRTNEVVALKRLKMEKEKDGFPITSLREINTLLKAQHENIVTVREIVVGSNTDKIFLVMDYVEHDLKALMETLKQKKQEFMMGEVKCLLIQLLRAVAHLHDNWILHRDLKTSNLLLSHKGILKVGDFGLAREYGSPLKSYTPIVVTLWYRAPELLLGSKEYSTPIDVWSVGCIFGELLKMEPMFPGKSEANQLNLIFQTLGTPNDKIWHGYSKMPLLQKMTFGEYPVNKLKTRFGILSETGIDLMNKFLTYNPAKRITAEEALNHHFFREAPLPIDPSIFPTWPAKSEMGVRKHASPKPPSGGRQFKDLKEDDSVGFFLGAGDRRPPMGAGFSLKF